MNILFHAVGGRHDPLGGDNGAATDVDALDVQADLPGPVPRDSTRSAHDPTLAAHLRVDPALWKRQAQQSRPVSRTRATLHPNTHLCSVRPDRAHPPGPTRLVDYYSHLSFQVVWGLTFGEHGLVS